MGHWYKDGQSFHTIVGANGVERDTTLRDARKLLLDPSVMTVLADTIVKPALETWKIEQGILSALTATRIDGESDKAFVARLLKDSKREALLAAEEGTRIHNAIEHDFRGDPVPAEYVSHVEAVRNALVGFLSDISDWVTEATFSHPLGFGGKVDLHSPSTGLVVDFKTKDGDLDKRLAYDQNIQLGAYQRGLGLPSSECASVFVSRTHPGIVKVHMWSADEIAAGWEVFEAALELWKRIKKYDPARREIAA